MSNKWEGNSPKDMSKEQVLLFISDRFDGVRMERLIDGNWVENKYASPLTFSDAYPVRKLDTEAERNARIAELKLTKGRYFNRIESLDKQIAALKGPVSC